MLFRYEIWKQVIELSDPQGENNAYRVLEVSPTASQPQITAQWRKLSKEFHPDKVRDPNLREAAQQHFMDIQQAYEILSKIKSKRKRKNKKSELWNHPDVTSLLILQVWIMTAYLIIMWCSTLDLEKIINGLLCQRYNTCTVYLYLFFFKVWDNKKRESRGKLAV